MRSVRDALDLLGGKWKLPIIVALSSGPRRFKQLQRDVTGITAKMLSKELKELEVNDLISRHVQADAAPIAVTYTLAAYGESLFPVIGALHDWGQQHRSHIMHPAAERAA
jgi:DNA-binding HxlR family transcriptional regulator